MFDIDTTKPIPQLPGKGRPRVYPFRDLAVGQSFWAPRDRKDTLQSAASWWKRRHDGWNYTTRLEGDGVRIWRTA